MFAENQIRFYCKKNDEKSLSEANDALKDWCQEKKMFFGMCFGIYDCKRKIVTSYSFVADVVLFNVKLYK